MPRLLCRLPPQTLTRRSWPAKPANASDGPALPCVSFLGTRIETEYLAGTDGTGRPLTADSALPVGSVSKSFTALAVLQFVHAGDV